LLSPVDASYNVNLRQKKEPAAALPAAFIPFGGSPLPFPRGSWEGWWARPGVYEPQLPGGELILLLAFFGLRALLFLQSVTAFELSYSRKYILVFREAEAFV